MGGLAIPFFIGLYGLLALYALVKTPGWWKLSMLAAQKRCLKESQTALPTCPLPAAVPGLTCSLEGSALTRPRRESFGDSQ
jgi:hypothetical protein